MLLEENRNCDCECNEDPAYRTPPHHQGASAVPPPQRKAWRA